MNDTPNNLIKTYTRALLAGDVAVLERCFHKDAAVLGMQDGLFITADRTTFLRFVQSLGLVHAATRAYSVEPVWEEQHGNLAVACVVEEITGAKVISYQTMLKTSEGWKIISRSFMSYEDEMVRPSPWPRKN